MTEYFYSAINKFDDPVFQDATFRRDRRFTATIIKKSLFSNLNREKYLIPFGMLLERQKGSSKGNEE